MQELLAVHYLWGGIRTWAAVCTPVGGNLGIYGDLGAYRVRGHLGRGFKNVSGV